jgi:hypothetical protein
MKHRWPNRQPKTGCTHHLGSTPRGALEQQMIKREVHRPAHDFLGAAGPHPSGRADHRLAHARVDPAEKSIMREFQPGNDRELLQKARWEHEVQAQARAADPRSRAGIRAFPDACKHGGRRYADSA